MGLLIGLGFKLGFISILHLPVPRAGLESPTPRSPFSNILRTTVLALYFARLRGLLTIKEESISI